MRASSRWPDPVDRFWSKVDKNGPVVRAELGPCWTWNGRRNPKGYGRIYFGDRIHGAHRLSLILSGVSIPDKSVACHHCDNPPCVNPAHLFVGTTQDNAIDMVKKGRLAPHGCVRIKLLAQDVRDIRSSPDTCAAIGRRLGVTSGAIRHIKKGTTWKHI